MKDTVSNLLNNLSLLTNAFCFCDETGTALTAAPEKPHICCMCNIVPVIAKDIERGNAANKPPENWEEIQERLKHTNSFINLKELSESERETLRERRRAYYQRRKEQKEAEKAKEKAIHGIGLNDKQVGKKAGKHAAEFGLNPQSEADRKKFKEIIIDIKRNNDEVRIGTWRNRDSVLFYIKGSDVVVADNDNNFITVLKDGINNARVKNAGKR